MTGYILCDTAARDHLFPFTYTRPIADCRIGILTIREKWEHRLQQATSTLTVDYLAKKFLLRETQDNFWINGALIPNEEIISALQKLNPGEQLVSGDTWLATRCHDLEIFRQTSQLPVREFQSEFMLIQYPWNLVRQNDSQLRDDFSLITKGRISNSLHDSNKIIAPENVFVEAGANVTCTIINASTGPVYIGKNAEIMEGTLIRGPFALCEGATVKMGAKIYGATTIGPNSVAAGEIKNSIIFGYSNKGHDGYLGDAVIGEWCNLGADTNCSNLKNNISPVKIWNESAQSFLSAGFRCGMFMGDYSRTGISTMINTGTLMGVSCNIFGGGFPPKYIPSFSWGGAEKINRYKKDKAIRDAKEWMKLKEIDMDEITENILRELYEQLCNIK